MKLIDAYAFGISGDPAAAVDALGLGDQSIGKAADSLAMPAGLDALCIVLRIDADGGFDPGAIADAGILDKPIL